MNGIVRAGDGIAKIQLQVADVVLPRRASALAYDVTGAQRLVVRGGVGLFYDRPDGNTVYSQVGNPPFSTSRRCAMRSSSSWRRGLDDSRPASADLGLASTKRRSRRPRSGTPACR